MTAPPINAGTFQLNIACSAGSVSPSSCSSASSFSSTFSFTAPSLASNVSLSYTIFSTDVNVQSQYRIPSTVYVIVQGTLTANNVPIDLYCNQTWSNVIIVTAGRPLPMMIMTISASPTLIHLCSLLLLFCLVQQAHLFPMLLFLLLLR